LPKKISEILLKNLIGKEQIGGENGYGVVVSTE